jgi:ATP/maltotriose-dependent transcriptional regulator MalT
MERARVTRRLSEASTFPIAILRGAAGSGKSVALRHYLESSGQPYLLYDVAPEHDTLARFVRGLADALGELAPGARLSFAGAYERAMQSRDPARDLSTWMGEHVRHLRTVIALDNAYRAESDPQIASFLTRLIEASTPYLRWILACRSPDLLPLPGWMAFRRMDVPIEDSELAFTLEDIAELASLRGTDVTARACAEISESTQGWATGVAFLLQAASPSESAEALAAFGPVRAYAALIRRILDGCDTWELRALLSTCYLPEVTPAFVGANAGEATADAVMRLQVRAPYLFVRGSGAIRYHDLFADALRARLDEGNPRDRSGAVELAAQALRRIGRFADAIELYLKSDQLEPVVAILERHGLELIEHGHADAVEAALLQLERVHHAQSSISIALRAIVESRRGRFDTAESWFNQALARAGDDDLQMIEIKYLYACDFMQRFRLDCIPLLQAHADDENVPANLRARILSALGLALTIADRPEAARAAIDQAIAIAQWTDDDGELRPLLLARAAYVYQDEPETGRHFALTSAEAAVATSAFGIATSAYSVLYAMADAAEDPQAALEYLDSLRDNGLKSGKLQNHFYFLACTLEIEAEQGDRAALSRTDAALESFEIHFDDATSKEALLPANALRATWHGKFDRAFHLLAPTAATQPVPDRTALRYAEVALYAAAALHFEACDEAVRNARVALAEAGDMSNRSRRALLLIALSLAIAGRSGEAGEAIEAASEGGLPPRLAALRVAVEALRDRCRGEHNHVQLSNALDSLRANDFGGFCRLFEALPIHAVFAQRVARLTAAERSTLQQVVDGGDVPEGEAEAVRAALDCASVAAMRESVIRTSALHGATLTRVTA